jgi:ribosome-binding factor A
MSRRQQRLNVAFRQELAEMIHDELRDPRLHAMVSITRVEAAPDLENASVYVSVLGDATDKRDTMLALKHAAPFLRRHLVERMHIRRIPHLQFVLDESIEEAAHVLDLMRQVSEKNTPDAQRDPQRKQSA